MISHKRILRKTRFLKKAGFPHLSGKNFESRIAQQYE